MELSKKTTKLIPKPTHFGKNLRFLRRLNGLSQSALADEVNMKRYNIASYESGMVEPGALKYIEVSEYFNIAPKEMLDKILSENPTFTSPIDPSNPQINQVEQNLNNQLDLFVKQTDEMTKMYEGYKTFFKMKKEIDPSNHHADLYALLDDLLELLHSLIQSNWNMIQSVYRK